MKANPLRTASLIATAMVFVLLAAGIISLPIIAHAEKPPAPVKIFVLMVWDGLRPDLVDKSTTPNLFALESAGVRFARHHSVYPTLTMVDAGSLATGAEPSVSGIFGDMMYLAPVLDLKRAQTIPGVGTLLGDPLNLEHSQYLAELNDPRALDGHLMGFGTTAQAVMASGGFVAVMGKQGPTLLFDDEFAKPQMQKKSPMDFMFVADDMAAPEGLASEFAQAPAMSRSDYQSVIARDAWFTRLITQGALPAAKAASRRGKPSFVVLWQHNPDLIQHLEGLGTQPAIDALRASDVNLGALRAAIDHLGLSANTDLVVVSDHGFATIKATVPLDRLLVAAHLKQTIHSHEVVVAADGGSDSIYLSRSAFPTASARLKMLQRIVDFVAPQVWSGPIFSRADAVADAARPSGSGGAVKGTFDESYLGLDNNARAPDLIVSFRELSDLDNRSLTGPDRPAIRVGPGGPEPIANHSAALVRPVPGAIYADAGGFTTGMGMHGAAGERELHNFGAAVGPDFRRGLIDQAPTGNADIAPTAASILRLPRVSRVSGRILGEALAGDHGKNLRPHSLVARTELILPSSHVISTLQLTRYGDNRYLDGSSVTVTSHP